MSEFYDYHEAVLRENVETTRKRLATLCKEMRKEMGLRQQDLGYSKPYICEVEKAIKPMSLELFWVYVYIARHAASTKAVMLLELAWEDLESSMRLLHVYRALEKNKRTSPYVRLLMEKKRPRQD